MAVIAILASIGISGYTSVQKDSRDQNRLQSLKIVEQGLEIYRSNNGYYPAGDQELKDVISSDPLDTITGYIGDGVFPPDPVSNQAYHYQARPLGCDNTPTGGSCLDFYLCAKKEGSKLNNYPCPGTFLSCGSGLVCDLGFAAR